MTYPSPSSINASKGLGEILTYVNTVTYGWISTLLLLAIYIIVLIGFYKARDDFAGAMAVAGFGVFIIALLFWLGNFITGVTLTIAIALALVGIIVLLIDKRN